MLDFCITNNLVKMKKVLVIGASGFVGRHLAKKLSADGYSVRCLARTPDKIRDLAKAGCELVQGDISEPASLQNALKSMDAVYITIHTIAAQPANKGSKDYVDVELNGLQNIVSACRENGVSRVIYVTFLGAAPDAKSTWIRGRWKAEQLLLKSGLDATIIRPGMIAGIGGQGFNAVVGNAKRRFAFVMGSGRQRFRCIAITDLVYYIEGVLNEPGAYGQAYDVGGDEILNITQMIDIVADLLGRQHPRKFHIPLGALNAISSIIEPIIKMQKGAMKGLVDSMKTESIGADHKAIAAILPKPLLTFRQSAEKALEKTL
jgi:uncharacterized protein YbjT (DUF2867 family)